MAGCSGGMRGQEGGTGPSPHPQMSAGRPLNGWGSRAAAAAAAIKHNYSFPLIVLGEHACTRSHTDRHTRTHAFLSTHITRGANKQHTPTAACADTHTHLCTLRFLRHYFTEGSSSTTPLRGSRRKATPPRHLVPCSGLSPAPSSDHIRCSQTPAQNAPSSLYGHTRC